MCQRAWPCSLKLSRQAPGDQKLQNANSDVSDQGGGGGEGGIQPDALQCSHHLCIQGAATQREDTLSPTVTNQLQDKEGT